ncbi:hypothetical protein [Longimicrobium sp.]|uniref:hypothetical protein n=1 Tax=Longimicrobium sp. TaxID=2029185 RepID=UPI002CA01026|nr:hypothetical protein [Longimicrobium sp.]HSU15560.1 hypothetical protein [Longimicrobium sp.]
MKKLKLEVESLRVDSFEPARTETGVGTVRAHAGPELPGNAIALDSTLSYLRPCFYTEQRTCTC